VARLGHGLAMVRHPQLIEDAKVLGATLEASCQFLLLLKNIFYFHVSD